MELKKTYIRKEIGIVSSSSSPFDLETFKINLNLIERKAKKDGFTKLQIFVGQEDGNEDNIGYNYIGLDGERLETEKEWHTRLEDSQRRCQRELETAQAIVNSSKKYTEKIENINKALETSLLKCEICGKPESGTIFKGNWKKSRRICHKCSEGVK